MSVRGMVRGMKPREAFLRELAERTGPLTRPGKSRSLLELSDGRTFVYVRYSRVHPKGATFYGLREEDLRELDGRTAFVALLWDGQDEPLLLPLAAFGELFDQAEPAADGQVKAQVYLRDGQPAELYVRARWTPQRRGLLRLGAAAQRARRRPRRDAATGSLAGADAARRDRRRPRARRLGSAERSPKMDWGLAPQFPFRATMPPVLEPLLREIDVVWMERGGGAPVSLYEIEHSTPIYSGLLRFNDVHLSMPEPPRFTVVAGEVRRGLFARQLRRPTFQASGLDRLCGFMTNAEVFRWHQRTPA